MLEEKVNWQYTDKLGMVKFFEQIESLTKQIVNKELLDIVNKVDTLQKMYSTQGLQNNAEFQQLKTKLKNIAEGKINV
jgi:uncharacterized radical SAM superfamily protein